MVTCPSAPVLNILKKTKSQLYIAPHPLLKKYIAHYTLSFPKPRSSFSFSESKELMLIPDASGCIVFVWNQDYFYESIWGPTTKIVTVTDDPSYQSHRFFIEFLSGGLYILTGYNQREFSDQQFSLSDVDFSLFSSITEALFCAEDINKLIEKVNRLLLNKIYPPKNIEHLMTDEIIDCIKRSKGNVSIKHLAESTYISQRHLNRLFERQIGMTPKRFTRLVRVNHTINMLTARPFLNSSTVAQSLGFFDESHLIRDFKEFCEVTPQTFLKKMSNFYNEPYKY